MKDALTIGVFDGLHLGHRDILARALDRAKQGGGRCIVVSFDPHPDLVLAPSFCALAPLTPLPEKREMLRALGVDALEVLPFTRELASLAPEDFVDRHLVAAFDPGWLVVGENFALGAGRAGNIRRLAAIGSLRGFKVDAVPLREAEGSVVSSSRIREALDAGRVADAGRWLGRRYALAGTVVRGEAIGRTLGSPTANLRLLEEKYVPAHGIYAVWVRIADAVAGEADEGVAGASLAGAMSIGVRPTFGGQVPTLEVHLLDWSGDLVGRTLTVEFVDWLRPERKYENAAALAEAIAADVEETRVRLANLRRPAPWGPLAPAE
ncbi:MAG: bifunctional riboflavin kinase/FAD synthetase [Candidatus Eisenbacteria bacterium]|nr:bifunctional riboflavin kinase/FAD synthetase [Candidatus Eisenbacteria bacterium]